MTTYMKLACFLENTNDQNRQEKIENLIILLSYSKNEFEVKNFPTKRTVGPDNFSNEFHQTFKE